MLEAIQGKGFSIALHLVARTLYLGQLVVLQVARGSDTLRSHQGSHVIVTPYL